VTFFPTPVVVGTEGTAASRHALLAAVELARATGSELHIAHVRLTSGTLHGRPMTPTQRERADDEARALLDREQEVAVEHGAEVAGTHLRYGERIDLAFASLQEDLGAGLLVIGDSPEGSLASRLMGGSSGSTGTVRRSRASVLVVRERVGMSPGR
jgi:nucleotide-binding universal stress UspA family protein